MGGGVMRTAAKAAASASARRAASVSASSASAATEAVPAISDSARVGLPVISSVQMPPMLVDDWVFAGENEELYHDSLHEGPRLVFGPVPTVEEAKEATSDLKAAIEKTHFYSSATSYEESMVPERSASTSMCLENLETKMCVADGSAAILPSTAKHVMQAFSLLQGSPEAQDVVASLASDKNVWDAVMKNEKVLEFYKSHQTDFLFPGRNVDSGESDAGNGTNNATPENLGFSSEEPAGSMENRFTSVVSSVKLKVAEMVSNLSDFFQDFLGASTKSGSSTTTKTATSDDFYVDMALGASFIALAIAVILVVLVKRG